MIQSFKNMIPVVNPSAYVHPLAVVIGHVTIGADCYIGPGAVLGLIQLLYCLAGRYHLVQCR